MAGDDSPRRRRRRPTSSGRFRRRRRHRTTTEVRDVVATRSVEQLYRIARGRVERYLPIWFAAHERLAAAAGMPEERRERHREAMGSFLDRADMWWSGERIVKARTNEIDSAISGVSHLATLRLTDQRWTVTARTAALTGRHFLNLVRSGPGDHQTVTDFVTRELYGWAEIETRFPGDSFALFQLVEHEYVRNGFDGSLYQTYLAPSAAYGLESEGLAVLRCVDDLVDHLDEPVGPFVVDDSFWVGTSDAFMRQRSDAYGRFHGTTNRPPWLRRTPGDAARPR